MSEPTLLDALLDIIDAATDGGWDQPATLWYAALDPTAADGDGVTIGYKVVDGHPYDHLVGFTAPDDWTVLGVSCCGWAGSLDAELPPSMQEGRRRIRQTFLVGRSGATASVVHFEDGAEPMREPPGVGRMFDALLRCLGLPTAPPELDPPVLFTSWWLEAIIAVGSRSPKRLTWKQVCDHHPGVRMLREAGERTLAGDVVLVGQAMARAFDWPRLHALFSENTMPGTIDPEDAAWMDEGMFSRHLLAEALPVETLLPEALDHVTPATAGRLLDAVSELMGGRAAA